MTALHYVNIAFHTCAGEGVLIEFKLWKQGHDRP